MRFITELFPNYSVTPAQAVQDFSDSCPGKQRELEDVEGNRKNFRILSGTYSNVVVTLNSDRTGANVTGTACFATFPSRGPTVAVRNGSREGAISLRSTNSGTGSCATANSTRRVRRREKASAFVCLALESHRDDSEGLDRWLHVLTERGAADLFLVAGFPPAVRLNGVVTPLPEDPLESDDIEAAVLPSLHPQALQTYRLAGSADISLRRPGLGRFRVNLHRERGRAAVTVRALPAKPPIARRTRPAAAGGAAHTTPSRVGARRRCDRIRQDDHGGGAGE